MTPSSVTNSLMTIFPMSVLLTFVGVVSYRRRRAAWVVRIRVVSLIALLF
jgi:hypothetical protein